MGHKVLMLDEKATRHGAVETRTEARRYAEFLSQHRGASGSLLQPHAWNWKIRPRYAGAADCTGITASRPTGSKGCNSGLSVGLCMEQRHRSPGAGKRAAMGDCAHLGTAEIMTERMGRRLKFLADNAQIVELKG